MVAANKSAVFLPRCSLLSRKTRKDRCQDSPETCKPEAFLLQVSILSSFESRLMKLENSIIPVHKQTENLQRLQENVEKTLSCLDHVISYYHVASDTEKVIREG